MIDSIFTVAVHAVAVGSVAPDARNASDKSNRRPAHEYLAAGFVAAAHVWKAADVYGRLLRQATGDGAGKVARTMSLIYPLGSCFFDSQPHITERNCWTALALTRRLL